jgi:hypothetical protein
MTVDKFVSRRRFLAGLVVGATLPATASTLLAAVPALPTLIVYKDPGCGCCANWVTHMQQNGFATQVHDERDMDAVKARAGVPDALRSCHTALLGDLVIEGHVPAGDVQRAVHGSTKVHGLALPGMVTGSPGMEGGAPEHYVVVAFDAAGKTTPFATH